MTRPLIALSCLALLAASPVLAASRPAADYWSGSDTGADQRLLEGVTEGAQDCEGDCVKVVVGERGSQRVNRMAYEIEVSRNGRTAWLRGHCPLDAIDPCARALRSRVDFQIRRLGAR